MNANDGCFKDQLQTDRITFHTSDPAEHSRGRGTISGDYSMINVFPNPSDGTLNVVFREMKGPLEIGLYDAVGQKVLTKQVTVASEEQRLTLDLGQLATGLYVLTCSANKKSIQSTKVIVK